MGMRIGWLRPGISGSESGTSGEASNSEVMYSVGCWGNGLARAYLRRHRSTHTQIHTHTDPHTHTHTKERVVTTGSLFVVGFALQCFPHFGDNLQIKCLVCICVARGACVKRHLKRLAAIYGYNPGQSR